MKYEQAFQYMYSCINIQIYNACAILALGKLTGNCHLSDLCFAVSDAAVVVVVVGSQN